MEKLLVMVDMDGTLFDTFEVNYCAYKEAIESQGFHLERNDFKKYYGKSYKEFLPHVAGECLGLMEKIHEHKKQLYEKYIFKARKNEMLLHILDNMKNSSVIVLVTTASRKNTEDLLTYFNMQHYFDLVISQEDVHQVKPNPECYQMAMKQYHVHADQCLIFEDSVAGICAARQVCNVVFKVESF